MTPSPRQASRARIWFEALAAQGAVGISVAPPPVATPPSLLCADASLGGEPARFLAVVPDPDSPFPRARGGEIGVREAWGLAASVRQAIEADRHAAVQRPLVAIVDTAGQAYGRLEELLGIHLALAAAVDAYASARLAGHPVVALVVGRAISGAFLAHGLQASCILALDDPGVVVHVMAKEAAALVLRRPVAELESLGETVLPMSYDIRALARLGLLHRLIGGIDAEAPSAEEVRRVAMELGAAVARARGGPLDRMRRVPREHEPRGSWATLAVRKALTLQWDLPP